MTDDLDIEMLEQMESEVAAQEVPASDEVAKPRFSINKDRFKKVVPENIVETASPESVPSSAPEDKLLECEACDNRVKTLHKLKSNNGKVSNLCKKCYDENLELPPIVPGDMSQPQNVTEQFMEADRRFAQGVIDRKFVKETEKVLNSEKLLTEDLLEGSMDPAKFREVFMNVIKQECIGKSRAEIEESIRRDHEMLFDKRAGIQAKLSFRTELLKSESAEARAAALKEDWLVKPLKQKAEKSKAAKAAGQKREKIDPIESMRKGLFAKGYSAEKVEKAIKVFLGTDD